MTPKVIQKPKVAPRCALASCCLSASTSQDTTTGGRRLNAAITYCRSVNDAGTCELLEHILVEEEAHVDWIETQLEAMKQVGEQNYLTEQLKEKE